MIVDGRRFGIAGLVLLALASSTPAYADAFMETCLVTTPQKTCECISARIAPEVRAAAVDGMRKSNASMVPGANPVDPANMTVDQMRGLNAVVAAQAYCM